MRDVKLALDLEPVYWAEQPMVKIKFNEQVLHEGYIGENKTFDWLLPANDNNRISVFLLNKTDRDTVGSKDKAVIIKSMGIEGFRYSSFMLQTQYRPTYTKGSRVY